MNMKSYQKVRVLRMRNNNFAEQFLVDIARQKESQELYKQLSDEEKRQRKIEQERERECLNNLIEQTAGSNPIWF